MFYLICQKLKHAIVTLRFSILSIFVTLFVIAVLSLIMINYLHTARTLRISTNQLMQVIAKSVFDKMDDELNRAEREAQLSANLIQEGIINADKIEEISDYTYQLANLFFLTEEAYWTNRNGSLITASYEDDDSITTEVINRDVTPPVKYYIHRDVQGNVKEKINSTDLSYDPRLLPLHLDIKKSKKLLWSDIYAYAESPYLGFTVAAPAITKNGELLGIFGLDIRLDWLSWYLDQQKVSPNAHIAILTENGDVMAYPKLYENQPFSKLLTLSELKQPALLVAFKIYQRNRESQFDFSLNGVKYLAVFNKFKQSSEENFNHFNQWIIAIVVPENDFIYQLKVKSLLDVAIGLLILVFGVWLVSGLTTRIVSPIKKIAKQTEKIQRFELADEKRVNSRIKEIIMLSDAVQAMRTGLQSFQKYVPASLVRQLIEAGEDAHIGGAKKTISILFTDIANFTHIAENMEPNLLMEHICEYFDALSKIILSEHGTIDKYIGDSIMAFWGAPLNIEQPEKKAALAALRCKRALEKLNLRWLAANKKPLFTRFGLHIGEAIVGNVGSSERLNFTALGDVINVASRLEDMNKIYGTTILISETLYQLIKNDFIFRKIDHVMVRGKSHSENIYELLAENRSELDFSIDDYNKLFAEGFENYNQQQWDDAIYAFERCLLIFPADTVAQVFIKRCTDFKKNPPTNWDGVWRI